MTTASTASTAIATLTAFVVLVGFAAAQTTAPTRLGPRSFFPIEYEEELSIDIAALFDSDILWEGIEKTALLGSLTSLRGKLGGAKFSDFDRLRAGSWGFGDSRGKNKAPHTGFVLESREPLEIVLPLDSAFGWSTEEIGGRKVALREYQGETDLYVLANPRCLVFGSDSTLRPILHGQRRGGVPRSGLLAFMIGKKAIVRWASAARRDVDDQIRTPFPAGWYSEDHVPRFWMLELLPSAKKGQVELAIRFRFGSKGRGPLKSAKRLREVIRLAGSDKAGKKTFRGLERVIERAEVEIEGRDVRACTVLDHYRQVEILVNLWSGRVSAGMAGNFVARPTTSLSLLDLAPLRWAGCVELGEKSKK